MFEGLFEDLIKLNNGTNKIMRLSDKDNRTRSSFASGFIINPQTDKLFDTAQFRNEIYCKLTTVVGKVPILSKFFFVEKFRKMYL